MLGSINDSSYPLMLEFLSNIKHHAGIGNIYVARSVDKNGKVTDVKFGKNIFTDTGMSAYFINKTTFPDNFYIGSGTSDIGFDYSSKELIEPYDTSATLVSNTRNYAFPMYFDNVSGVISVVCLALRVKFPLSISGLPDAIPITEYGIGTAKDNLWTHSFVYDTIGHYAEMIKYPEQELYIDVYFCMSYNESMILSNWANHRYTAITTLGSFFNTSKRMEGTIYSFRRGNMKTSRSSTITTSNFQNGEITKYINLDAFTMYRMLSETDGYLDGLCFLNDGFTTIEREQLTSPEAFDEIVYPQGFKDTCISDKFGNYDSLSIPITQANILNAYLYNPNTHQYDIQEVFQNDPDKWYTETFLERTFAQPLYYTNNNTIVQLYLYQNINTHDPILSFDNNMETVYACEKYWDKTTWHHITNLLQVPANDTNSYGHTLNCQTARYFTTSLTSESVSLVPHRQSDGFVIIPTNGRSQTYPFIKAGITLKEVNGSEQYAWYKYGNNLYFPNQPAQYTLSDLSESAVHTIVYGKWLIAFISTNNSLIYYDMSDPTSAPTAQRLSLSFNSKTVNVYSGTYRTENGRGLVTVQSKSYNISYVIDFTGNTPVATEFATTKMCAIWGTDRIAYVLANDTSHIQIFEFGTTNSIVQTLDVPASYTIACMFGHTNYLYLSSTTSGVDGHCFDITTGVDTPITALSNIRTSNDDNLYMSAVDECFIIYRRSDIDFAKHYWFRMTDPTTVNTLTGLASTYGYNQSLQQYFLTKVHNGAILLLRVSGRANSTTVNALSIVVDFGNWMDGNKEYAYVSPQSSTDDAVSEFIPYGGYIISSNNIKYPMEHWLPHRLVGTTNTISTLNHIINIRNKQYRTTFSNVCDFRGLPPGVKQ